MIWAVGDVHGCLKTLKALVSKIRDVDSKADIHLLGDLIDRGPQSLNVIAYARKENFKVIMGNHELIALEHYHNSPLSRYVHCDWRTNGGEGTELSEDVQNYLKALPFFIYYPDVIEDGKSLFLSHSCSYWETIRTETAAHKIEICWNRDFDEQSHYTYLDEPVYSIFGHTEQEKVMITDNFACVDTGCVYGFNEDGKHGVLTAISFPGKKIIQQELIDALDDTPEQIVEEKSKKEKYPSIMMGD